MMNDPLFLLAAFAALVVAAILLFGIGTFAKGGEFNKRNANKIMRWRLIAQFIAVVLIVGFAWLRSRGGN
ncbi:twin transmembrane helix small protein [Neotabrizicola sp. VNH66]|uniref:twin transmembrane helix small protein n=1 Tax=Neotabrizicola sp. VNH66 TaxID=3400918 RepID=UPI003C09EA00